MKAASRNSGVSGEVMKAARQAAGNAEFHGVTTLSPARGRKGFQRAASAVVEAGTDDDRAHPASPAAACDAHIVNAVAVA